jgi:acyl transferase domain-containing protein/acyl carrier protein/methylmalonyl-CoA mutase cobalamin-binding subunit
VEKKNRNHILNEPIAIVGMNCQFPGVDLDIEHVDAFFEMLLQKQTPIKDVPKNRWNIDEYYDLDRKKSDKIIGHKGGFLRDYHLFDANFFKIPGIEAKQMDPQHRLFLEVAVRALNHANITLESLNDSKTGVFCGISTQDYGQLNYKDHIEFNAYTVVGSACSAAAGRLSHFLNLKGPSITVDTACSSSFSALYLAVNALRNQQCSLAFVGGVHLSLCPESFIGVTKANMLSATDRCRSFDIHADGYVRSEGCGVVLVKRLTDAIKDKNTIYAVIKSIVMNQDGHDGTSLVAPNIKAQIALHEEVLSKADLRAQDIDYIETHGTGTFVGDSVEFNAIEKVHQNQHSQEKPLVVGAVKSNLGHSISSSGMASLIKVVGALTQEVIPSNLYYTEPNRSIHPEVIPALLPTKSVAFKKQNHKKRYVQISNFGFTGTNVSAILEEAPNRVSNSNLKSSEALQCAVISAQSEYSLKKMLADFARYLHHSSDNIQDICYTLINHRDHYKYRCVLVGHTKKEFIKKIESEEYELSKVEIKKDIQIVAPEATQISEVYLAGSNIRLEVKDKAYNQVELPLYHFERQFYWHDSRIDSPNPVEQQPVVKVLNYEPIAIIGMSCRFPKAENRNAFLTLLDQGESGMVDIPLSRWDNQQFYDPDVDAPGRLYIKQLGLIDHIKTFDAEFFNISPREAKFMAPSLRVLLETSYHAIEDANLSLDAIKGSNTGVFIGCGRNEYPNLLTELGVGLDDLNVYYATGNVLNALPARIAYSFDFHGPLQTIDTACSSSMTAIHNACLSLQSGDCDMAFAGGINVLLLPDSNITLCKARMLSPESLCKTFSEDADGYARSEGCGVLVLKRLSKALKDKDNILALIKGTSVNSDGKSGGFTVPNGVAQEKVIRSALAKAELSPADIDYVEAHGTGTPLGDPIETNTLVKIFSDSHSKENPLYLSSVKTNIGHSESAAGVAGVIKAVLSLQYQKLFKHLNFKKLNPEIELINTVIPLQTRDWPKKQGLKCVGVSSYGFSGANAHLVLQEVPPKTIKARKLPEESILLLSAKSNRSLELMLAEYQKYLSETEEQFADICYTAATCRTHYLFRVALIASSAKEAAAIIARKEYTVYQIKKEHQVNQPPNTLAQKQAAYQLGFIVPWVNFYDSLGVPFNKVKLPLYAFAREEYWFESKTPLKGAPLPKDWYFQIQWQPLALNKNNSRIQGNNWLLIGANHLASGFKDQGLNIVLEDQNEPFKGLEGIIFATGLDLTSSSDIEVNVEAQKQLIKKLLNLVKKLNQQTIALKLIVLTHHALAELVVDKLNLIDSPLVGFCKTLVLELPQFKTILIDLDKSAHVFTQVADEINYNHGMHYEHVVAYREGKRWVTRLKKITLLDKPYSFQGEGRYLITGGCGGLGLVTAQALLSAGAKELILTSRTPDKPEIKEAIKKIRAAHSGKIIRVLSLDVTHQEQVRQMISKLNADGLLKGIIHAAGTAIKAPLLEHEEQDVDSMFSAKVKGGWILHELTKDLDLEFFVVYSSIASAFGSNKESVYSATNSFLDALIAERQRLGLVGLAVQWGPWGEVGMAQKRSQIQKIKHALITNEQGQTFIKVLLSGQFNQIALISSEYLRFMLDFVPETQPEFYKNLSETLFPPKEQSPKSSENTLSSWLSEYKSLNIEARFEACKELVYGICKNILELSDLDEEAGFFELGFDSLMMTEMATQLKNNLDPVLKVTVNIGFDYPTINKLAHHIKLELDNKLNNNSLVQTIEKKQEVEDIAIIGMSCVFPNAPDIAAFEDMLEKGLSGMKDIPLERWDNSKYYDSNPDAPGKSYVKQLGLIEHIQCFDANFFGISPREAKLLDPQQRLFLECSYKALENANYPPYLLKGSLTGVFAGTGVNEYYLQLEKSGFSGEELGMYLMTGNLQNLISGRVSYVFDFKGPSISVDTACSSSLVAIHYACDSLKNHEIDYALAGGVNVLLDPKSNVTLCRAKALSPESLCKTFDEGADGYARSEGCGVVFLKRLSDAIRDKDTILAVIKASAVNNDGKSAGLTVPNGKSQEEVMLSALNLTNLRNTDISYIEAHGTGTPLGDPIEIRAINQVYGAPRNQENPLYVGAVKTNIGHLESASGISSVIKTVLSLQNKKIYKHLNFYQLNPNIQLGNTRIALETTDWKTGGKLKCAGVNSFGFSGTNAHLILQEFPAQLSQSLAKSEECMYPLVLSAKSETALNHLAKQYQHYLETTQNHFGDICFTAATCRDHYAYRLAVMAKNSAEAAYLLAKQPVELLKHASLEPLLKEYLSGEKVDWNAYYKNLGDEFVKVTLPNYVFDLNEYWGDKKSDPKKSVNAVHPLLGQMFCLPNNEYLFINQLDLKRLSYIEQHYVFDKLIFPATAYIESGLAIAKILFKNNTVCLERFAILRPVFPKQDQEFQFQVKPKNEEQYTITVFVKNEQGYQACAEMEIHVSSLVGTDSVDLNSLKTFFNEQINCSQIYEHFKHRALFYGEEFQVLQEGYVKEDSVLSRITLNPSTSRQGYYYHPIILDGAIQSILLLDKDSIKENTYVPYALTRMKTYQEAPRSFWVHLIKRPNVYTDELSVDLKLYNNSGILIGEIEELRLRKVTRNNFISYELEMQHLYLTQWSKFFPKIKPQLLPEFLVIANNPAKARQLLGSINYQLILDPDKLEKLAHKDIIFIYEQEQFDTLFHFCQKMFHSSPRCFILVTEYAYAVTEQDQVNPYHTMAASFWKSFRNEFDLARNYLLDVNSNNELVDALKYLCGAPHPESQLALRESLYSPRLKKKQIFSNLMQIKVLFDPESTYLITGGTGAVAKLLMEYLINRGVRWIVITSRSSCPQELSEFIKSSKSKQVFIKHHKADTSNFQDMKQIIEEITNSPHQLKGVFHLAGMIQDGLIVNLDDIQMHSVLNAKVEGALVLHQLTQKHTLDLFVMFSSSASLLGARGQANYAAANGFLDGLAYLRQKQGLPAMSINWGPFNALGMTAKLTQAMQQHGFLPLNKESIDILDVLLSSQLPQIALCPIRWEVYFKYVPIQAWLSELTKKPTLNPPDQHFLNVLRQHTPEERITLLNQVLTDIVSTVLELEDSSSIIPQTGLFSLGLDSLMALDIRTRMYDKLQCPTLNLPIEYFINDPSIEKISRNIAEELKLILHDVPVIQSQIEETSYPEELAVCDFQYVFWVLNKLNYNFNLGMQIQLQGKLNQTYLAQAFEFVVNQNDTFWISFNETIPTQILNREGQFKLIYQDISLSVESKHVLHVEFHKNIMSSIPLNHPPLIRVYLYKISQDLHEVHIVIPHILVDDTSCELVFAQFKQAYEELILEKKPVPIPERSTYLNYVTLNNNHYEKNLRAKINFWKTYNKGFSMLSMGKHCHLTDAAVSLQRNLVHYPIEEQAIKKFIVWHKEKNINASTGLIAACQVVFYKLSQQNKIPITLLHSGRSGSQYKEVIGLFSEYKRINISLDDPCRFIDCLNRIEDQLLKTAPYQGCSHFIKNIGLNESGLSITQYGMYLINKLTLGRLFKKTKLNPLIINYYLEYLSRMLVSRKSMLMKFKLNRLFNLKLPLQKPNRMRVLLSITPSFFAKPSPMDFANLHYSFPGHFECMDRPIGNQTLWIYFSKNQKGEYQLSINGPLTKACKDQIAAEFNILISKIVDREKDTVWDLIHS